MSPTTQRFREGFGLVMLVAVALSVALPRRLGAPVENSLQLLFAPISWPMQRLSGRAAMEKAERAPEPLVLAPEVASDKASLAALDADRRAWMRYAQSLREQLETLRARQAEYDRVGERLRGLVRAVDVVGVESSRDVLRLAPAKQAVEAGAPVACEAGIVGRVLDGGAGRQASVRLITDRGFKLVGRFYHARATDGDAIALEPLPIEPSVFEGMGDGEMRIQQLTTDVVKSSGLRVGDIAVLADDPASRWPIALHGQHVGVVTFADASLANRGVAEVRVRPEVDLKKLRQVWLILPPEQMPARE